jgi:hypothetical protein
MKKKFCTSCHATAKPKKVTKGSFLIEVILWITFIIPGLVYSIWRITTRQQACPLCGSFNIIPLNSPAALKHLEQNPEVL